MNSNVMNGHPVCGTFGRYGTGCKTDADCPAFPHAIAGKVRSFPPAHTPPRPYSNTRAIHPPYYSRIRWCAAAKERIARHQPAVGGVCKYGECKIKDGGVFPRL